MDFAAQQARQFAADGKTQAGPTVLSAGAGIRLLEGLEGVPLFFERNADSGIGHFQRDYRRRLIENRVLLTPASDRSRSVEAYAAVFGELEGVRQEVLEHLLQALGVGHDVAVEIGI